MPVWELATNLESNLFPFLTELWGRTVIIPTYDMNYNKSLLSTEDPGFEKGTPQVFYMHNVMPTPSGYQAIGYTKVLDGIAVMPPSLILTTVYSLQTVSGNRFLFSPAGGLNYIYDQGVGGWASVSPFAVGTVPQTVQVTTAFVSGETYIYYANYGCFKYNDTTKVLTPIVLGGLVAANILGICSANGYMIAWTATTVAWSALTDPTDFVPSLSTGAGGGGGINEAHGYIKVCLPVAGGFIAYCEFNAVGAAYTGNTNFPYTFKEITGSGGVVSMEQISWVTDTDYHVVYGKNGLQYVNKTKATTEHAMASDFLSSKVFEDFDETTLTFSLVNTTEHLNTRVVIIEARFIVLSYSLSTNNVFTHAIVFDLAYKRWGKLKIDHTVCFNWNPPNLFGAVIYNGLDSTAYDALYATTYDGLNSRVAPNANTKRSIAFMKSDGAVYTVNFDLSEDTANGVFMIGKFQFRRNNWIKHQSTAIDTVDNNGVFNLYIIPTYDGKTLLTPIPGYLLQNSSKTRRYNKDVSAQSVAVMCIGQFNIASLTVTFQMLGSR